MDKRKIILQEEVDLKFLNQSQLHNALLLLNSKNKDDNLIGYTVITNMYAHTHPVIQLLRRFAKDYSKIFLDHYIRTGKQLKYNRFDKAYNSELSTLRIIHQEANNGKYYIKREYYMFSLGGLFLELKEHVDYISFYKDCLEKRYLSLISSENAKEAKSDAARHYRVVTKGGSPAKKRFYHLNPLEKTNPFHQRRILPAYSSMDAILDLAEFRELIIAADSFIKTKEHKPLGEGLFKIY
ncbi:MAG: hypothetical protein HRT87_06740 [Legionellales bacterium]|nr:hypothetical protein [Legionellales bacterium]